MFIVVVVIGGGGLLRDGVGDEVQRDQQDGGDGLVAALQDELVVEGKGPDPVAVEHFLQYEFTTPRLLGEIGFQDRQVDGFVDRGRWERKRKEGKKGGRESKKGGRESKKGGRESLKGGRESKKGG